MAGAGSDAYLSNKSEGFMTRAVSRACDQAILMTQETVNYTSENRKIGSERSYK